MALSAALRAAGFRRQDRGDLWIRTISPTVVHAVATAEGRLECGVWLPFLAAMVGTEQDRHLDDISGCHLRLTGCSEETADCLRLRLAELARFRTVEDVDEFLASDAEREWPASPAVAELYRAGIGVMIGAPDVLWRARMAATHLQGTGLARAAGHIYAMVATAE